MLAPMRLVAVTMILTALTGAMSAAEAAGDLVILDNYHRLDGTLENDPASKEHVLVRNSQGTLRLRRSRIRSVELGLPSRMAQLKDDDLAGLVELARWCRDKGHNVEALQLLERARKLPGLALEDAGLYAQLIDEMQGPEAAVPLYAWYRTAGGADRRVLARIKELEDAGADLSGPGTAPAMAAAVKPEAPVATAVAKAGDGLELKGWGAESAQYSNQSALKLVDATEKDGFASARKVLEVAFTGGDKDKAAVRRSVSYSVAPDAALLAFTVANRSEQTVRIALAVKTGSWVYFESDQRLVPKGEVKELRFDLRAKTYKCAASEWAHSSAIQNLDDVKEIQVLIYNKDKSGAVWISEMAFVPSPEQ